jgi:hypothetical protein
LARAAALVDEVKKTWLGRAEIDLPQHLRGGICDHPVMFESHSDGHGLGDPARCPICGRRTKRVHTIARTFQDDLEVWKCRSCGTSVTQTVNLAKHLAKREQQARGSTHLN